MSHMVEPGSHTEWVAQSHFCENLLGLQHGQKPSAKLPGIDLKLWMSAVSHAELQLRLLQVETHRSRSKPVLVQGLRDGSPAEGGAGGRPAADGRQSHGWLLTCLASLDGSSYDS